MKQSVRVVQNGGRHIRRRRCADKRRIHIDGRKQLLLSSYGIHLSFESSQFWRDVWRESIPALEGHLSDVRPAL